MSDHLKVGDRVKIVPDKDGQIYAGAGTVFSYQKDINGLEGEVKYVDNVWGSAHIQTDNGPVLDVCQQCLTRIERPRRTFEEIVTELIATLNELAGDTDYGLFKINEAGTAEIWWEPLPGELTYYSITNEGEFGTDDDYTFTPAAHLVAIAAACQEIAANYEAEHGEETQA